MSRLHVRVGGCNGLGNSDCGDLLRMICCDHVNTWIDDTALERCVVYEGLVGDMATKIFERQTSLA